MTSSRRARAHETLAYRDPTYSELDRARSAGMTRNGVNVCVQGAIPHVIDQTPSRHCVAASASQKTVPSSGSRSGWYSWTEPAGGFFGRNVFADQVAEVVSHVRSQIIREEARAPGAHAGTSLSDSGDRVNLAIFAWTVPPDTDRNSCR